MSTLIKDLGAVSAYAYAVEKGYTGTEDEFASLMYDYTDVIQIASEARDGAVAANASAQEAKTEAQTASNTANEAANKATSKASEASASVTEAGKATNAAVAAKTAAETAQQRAETAQQASEDAQRKAEIAKNEAQENATIANNKASKASQYATTATNKASEASTSAKNAKTYSEQSQASATTANTKADEASASANSARVSADNAQQSATNAQTYMNSSSTSASKAQANAEKTQSDKEAVESAKSDVLSAVDNAQNYANSAQSASQAIQNMDVEATTLEPDSDATVEKTVDAVSGAVTLTYGIPKGQVGEKGDKGNTGDSGVYIGTSAPLDENVKVWIDSDGEPDNVILIDTTPTQGSSNAVSSGGVYEALADVSLRPSIPVRQAIFALLESAGYATTTGVSDNLAIVEAWVNATTAITLSQTSLTLASRGATSQLTATTVPSGNTVLWESSDASVATVDSTGLVTAVSVGTATISAVSGDIRARCTVTASWEIPNTTAQIAQENMKFYDNGNTHTTRAQENAGITIVYEMDTPTTVLYPAGVIVGDGLTSNNENCTMHVFKDGAFVNYWGIYGRWLKAPASSYEEYKRSTNVSEYNEIAFTLDMRYLDDSYMYDYTTGQIWFAGINTPYYGMSNVSEAV